VLHIQDLIEIRADGTVVIKVHVQPGATRSGVLGRHGGALKIAVTAPADAGRANDAVIRLIAEITGVRPAAVELLSGRTSRAKRIAVRGVPPEAVLAGIGNALTDPGVTRRKS
jgi:hypothetical protein